MQVFSYHHRSATSETSTFSTLAETVTNLSAVVCASFLLSLVISSIGDTEMLKTSYHFGTPSQFLNWRCGNAVDLAFGVCQHKGQTWILFVWRNIRHYSTSKCWKGLTLNPNFMKTGPNQNRLHIIPPRSLVFGSSDKFKWLDIVQEPVFQKWCKGPWNTWQWRHCVSIWLDVLSSVADHPLINCFTSSQLALSKCSRSGFSFRSWFKRLANYIIPYCALSCALSRTLTRALTP